MTACPDKLLLLQGLVDGELDAGNSVALEAHLQDCAGCRAELDRIAAVRALIADSDAGWPAPADLRRRIVASIDDAADAATGGSKPADTRAAPLPAARSLWRFAAGLAVGVMAGIGTMVALERPGDPSLQDQFVASHVRSLQVGHLTDVTTSDRHLVKPWFNGKIDFAPPVPELAAQGYPLVGGRLDYAAGRDVAAIVYQRRLHRINLFVRPAQGAGPVRPGASQYDGYNIVHWSAKGLDYWAVSDLNAAELGAFQQLFAAAR